MRIFRKLLAWIRGWEHFYGMDFAVKDTDYSCFVVGKRYKDGTVVIEDVKYKKGNKDA